MECYCEPNEGDPCEVWNATWRKARKSHKCQECLEEIKPGDRYQYVFIVFQGEVSNYKACKFCANETERVIRENDLSGLVPGELACALVAELRGDL